MHLMSSGRLQLFDRRAGLRDRTSRLLVRIADGRELRLREFGTKQAAWVKLLQRDALESDESLARLGPEAWPEPPADLGSRLSEPRPLHAALRDQRVIAGIGRSWVDEILWTARLSPFKRGSDLDADELAALSAAIASTLERALEHYERTIALPIPDKLPMPLEVHRHEGEPCPRCGTRARGGQLRGLRDELLPELPDRGSHAQGPAALAAVEVGRLAVATHGHRHGHGGGGDRGRAAAPHAAGGRGSGRDLRPAAAATASASGTALDVNRARSVRMRADTARRLAQRQADVTGG